MKLGQNRPAYYMYVLVVCTVNRISRKPTVCYSCCTAENCCCNAKKRDTNNYFPEEASNSCNKFPLPRTLNHFNKIG